MEPLTVAALLALVDWKAVAKKLATDSATTLGKSARASLLQRFLPDQREQAARHALRLFTEEFLRELEDKSPLSAALPGYRDQLKRFLEDAAPDLAAWLQPDVKTIDLDPVARLWTSLGFAPLPADFDWPLVASNYARTIRNHVKRDPALRDQLAIALQQDSHDFDQRFGPGFDLAGYRKFLQDKCGTLQLSAMHASA
jgi:hypothetical protein